ncbi:Coronin-like protein crn1 [Orbilia oligospora]|uniref:Coronin n=1 Tax=Orbilia oligospora TaxID=2813651 RepID=A0A7C8IX14_ORBOL|nr:Coronin-like protein crn1 [Orbilia oligospora]KAF3081581.1 Coronin-like protein crn1 [Orbilia oligospora]KAF3106230.1 Coronin-like protein crn1 [Orbilia oligospora]KAF3137839.1 Coronin-like protein crn1 [Orbilia oligospora]KAF3141908.1 Coronin-like protein crn1 [Orbilia oligospora]
MSRFVRSSKYRHVFGRPTKKEQCYDNLHISRNAWDSNLIKANPKYLSVNWESGGGGAFAVIPHGERGKLPDQIPLFRGHTAAVLDTDWNPFHDDIVVSASDDAKIFVWRVPEDFTVHVDEEELPAKEVKPEARLSGHQKKVGHVLFHPAAEHVLASSSGDFTVKIWDIVTGQAKLTLRHPEVIQSMSFNADGSVLATTNRDKKLRLWDLRQQAPVYEGPGHAGAKNSRAVWLGDLDRIATTGFSKMSDRQLGLWDIRNPGEPIGGFQLLDSMSGVCMPFWDDGTKCLYLAGKGDGNIRYYEYSNDDFVFLSEYKSSDPQRGVAFVPKRGVDVKENEVMRGYKTVNDLYIEPISFIVPRRAETFQDDIYPDTQSGKPGLTGDEWFGGKNALPPTFSLGTLYSDDYVPPEPSAAPIVKHEPVFSPTTPVTPVIAKEPEPPAPEPVAEATPEPETPTVVVEAPKETPVPAPIVTISPPESSSAPAGPTVSVQDLNGVLSNLQLLHHNLAAQSRTIAQQQDICSKLIKEVEALKAKTK